MTKDELLKDLFVKYELFYDKNDPESKSNDVYIHKHYKVITRAGIQKIEAKSGIEISLVPVHGACGADYFVIQATGIKGEKKYSTFASASAANCKNAYCAEMAEKRARSRIVLTLEGLYQQGFYGADEMSKGDEPKAEPQVVKKTLFATQSLPSAE